MSEALPKLRLDLDFFPSPEPARPGVFIRDPFRYSDSTLLIPPLLIRALACFDGEHSPLDLRAELVRVTGDLEAGKVEKQLCNTLDEAGFLETERYRQIKSGREAEFRAERERAAIFAGSAYPNDRLRLADLLAARIGAAAGDGAVRAIAAPHASPEGGWDTYRAAYRALPALSDGERPIFLILGTSHYGAPDRFGLTRKAFNTPFGSARTNAAIVGELASKAGEAILMEDYCHAVEHSIEFQIVFLQHVYGPDVEVVPILCGPFAKSICGGGMPEDNEAIARFFDALGELAVREGRRLFWVLGIDMAHIGRRYGDSIAAHANADEMLAVAERDRERIRRLEAGDASGYWSLVQENRDDLKWCGASPLYTFLKAMPGVRAQLLDYHQWQIDPQSVVSFGALAFQDPERQ
ncbi:MAG: AmmeMemoRadiSam system protein B, partial [Bryobacteraceae bacterium]